MYFPWVILTCDSPPPHMIRLYTMWLIHVIFPLMFIFSFIIYLFSNVIFPPVPFIYFQVITPIWIVSWFSCLFSRQIFFSIWFNHFPMWCIPHDSFFLSFLHMFPPTCLIIFTCDFSPQVCYLHVMISNSNYFHVYFFHMMNFLVMLFHMIRLFLYIFTCVVFTSFVISVCDFHMWD